MHTGYKGRSWKSREPAHQLSSNRLSPVKRHNSGRSYSTKTDRYLCVAFRHGTGWLDEWRFPLLGQTPKRDAIECERGVLPPDCPRLKGGRMGHLANQGARKLPERPRPAPAASLVRGLVPGNAGTAMRPWCSRFVELTSRHEAGVGTVALASAFLLRRHLASRIFGRG